MTAIDEPLLGVQVSGIIFEPHARLVGLEAGKVKIGGEKLLVALVQCFLGKMLGAFLGIKPEMRHQREQSRKLIAVSFSRETETTLQSSV